MASKVAAMVRAVDDRLGYGVFRGSAAIADGVVTEHRLRSDRFTRLIRDVYVASDVPVSHELRCQAASLIIPDSAVLTGRSAAVIRGVPLAGRWDPVEIAVPERSRFGPVTGLVVRRVAAAPLPAVLCRGLRLGYPARMAFDLAIRRDRREAVADLDQVLRAAIVDQEVVTRFLADSRERNVRRARRAWELADGRAESRPESRLRLLLVAARLRPVPQFEVWDANGFVARVDLGFPDRRVAVEYDGAWHADEKQLRRDRRRLNRLREAGWDTVFITSDMLFGDPRAVVRSVRAALAARDKRAYRAL